jgi:hypothetical protein
VVLSQTQQRAREVPVDLRVGRERGDHFRALFVCHCGLDVSRFRLAYGWAIELEAVGVVDDAVENGVGECWSTDDLVPLVDGQQAGDECRAAAMVILDDDRRRGRTCRLLSRLASASQLLLWS